MKTLVFLAAMTLTTLIALPVHANGGSCPTDSNPDLDLAGTVYARPAPGNGDPVPFIYIEINGIEGLQYGGPSLVSEYSELGTPCKDGDQLIY